MRVIIFLAAGFVLLPAVVSAEEITDAKVSALAERMQKIEQVLNNQALIDLAQRTAALQREVRELRGEIERLRYELDSIKTLQREQFLSIDRRLQSVSATPATAKPAEAGSESTITATTEIPVPAAQDISPPAEVDVSSGPAASEPAATGQVVLLGAATDATRDYKTAFTLLKGGKYDDSIAAFELFLHKHPDSKYAANAQYWLAEAKYVSKRYPRALAEFSTVVSKYPASSKLADARLKLGFTYYELGQYQEARDELTRLRAQFPNSNVAKMAQQRLERMSREGY